MYRIFSYDGKYESTLDRLISDDRVQTLSVSRRDGSDFNVDGKIVVIEGNQDTMNSVFASVDFSFLNEIKGEKKDYIYKKIQAEDDEAAGGLGFIFQ